MKREHLALTFAIQRDEAIGEDSFRGLASVFHTLIDTWVPTRILPGAFTKTLQENAKRIKVLYQHNPDWPIGIPTRMEENSDGLDVTAKVSQTTMGKEVLQLIRDGVLTELSIGFDPVKYEMVDEGATGLVRHLKELRLWEISPVTFAANADARISAVNSLALRLSRQEMLSLCKQLIFSGDATEALEAWSTMVTWTPELIVAVKEQHEGKVLSAKNRALVSDAVAALQKLLDAAEPKEDEQRRLSLTAVIEQVRALEVSLLETRVKQ